MAAAPRQRIEVVVEATPKKTFASALDWPGWSRSGKTREAAIEALLAYAPRFAPVAKLARLDFPDAFAVEVVYSQKRSTSDALWSPTWK